MPSLPSDPAAALTVIAVELTGLRRRVDALAQQLERLTAENGTLRARLEHSETARADLVAQAEHVVELLAEARTEVRALQGKHAGPGS